MKVVLENLDALKKYAQETAHEIHPPLLVLIHGNLGAGKTTLVSAILEAWGVESANSPTFNLRNDYYPQNFHAAHLDFYRLKNAESAWDILPFDEDFSQSVVFVEWPEKVDAQLFTPFSRKLEIFIDVNSQGHRIIEKK
ncbi:MAG TPA: tRNA (adenosine(37)-N6)-threonylcarbamoyltransferase complex ATPase subunit type 1 TsaE [Turneriella sp.]|nr:tRNA (adenosine(37)-N6)-threonylcarbamoyltransferase complex ATPase subunit type 1 TsaE [Turneriella sp.]